MTTCSTLSSAIRPLQRSRARESAECRTSRSSQGLISSFNGAALVRARSGWEASAKAAEEARLQRSRARESAEWLRRALMRSCSFTLQRSRARESAECAPAPAMSWITLTLQRSRARESAEWMKPSRPGASKPGFNGAALVRARSDAFGVPERRLNRRFNGAALVRARSGAGDFAHSFAGETASTEPRS